MERNILYNLKPVGIGTPYVESLTSYITRIADAHCVLTGDIISRIYAPYLNKEYLSKISKRGGGFYDSAIGINGVGKLAYEFSELTNKLTGRKDLSNITLKNWSELLPNRGLLRKTKSWCPICYEESKLNDMIIHDQLIWNFQVVNYCLKHKTLLLNTCKNCKNTVPIIDRKSLPGFCSRCGKWLGFIPSIEENIKDKSEILSDVFLIGELLSKNDLAVNNVSLFESLRYYVNEGFNKSPLDAAKYFEIPKSTFMTWMSSKNLPSIHYLIHMCKILGISIVGFLQKQEPVIQVRSTESFVKVNKKYDHDEIKWTLKRVIEDKHPVSISGVAKMIGCDRKLLSAMYKIECSQIKENYNVYIQSKKKERFSEKNQKLKNVFNLLVNQGVYPSRRRLEEHLGTGFLKEIAMKKKWSELKRSCMYDKL
ncbi:TniQ family protein [Salipaludibacillus sp. CF4.18]|uniref:TniQ family protein n=1 Tax=Salipaludibacillus sp. CF4.18 TaxID=3373081 RepID=UPI003EE488DF